MIFGVAWWALLLMLVTSMVAGGITGHLIVRGTIRAWEQTRIGHELPTRQMGGLAGRHHVPNVDFTYPPPEPPRFQDPAQGGVHPEEVE